MRSIAEITEDLSCVACGSLTLYRIRRQQGLELPLYISLAPSAPCRRYNNSGTRAWHNTLSSTRLSPCSRTQTLLTTLHTYIPRVGTFPFP